MANDGQISSGLADRIGGLLESVPGYRGYKNKEERRDADKRVRERAAAAFAAQAERVERVGNQVADQRRLKDIGPVNDLAQAIRHLVDRVANATYGYGGIFSDRNVDEHALDQLRIFDESLLASANDLNAPITALEGALASNGDLSTPSRTALTATRTILDRLDLRNEVVETGRPVPEDKIADILSPKSKEELTPPPAYNLNAGDALAILGDNYVVDGRIDLEFSDKRLRLHRLNQSPEQWLLVPADRGQSFALLTATGASDQTTGTAPSVIGNPTESTIANAAYIVNWSNPGTGAVSGRGGSMDGRSVTVTMLDGKDDPNARALILDWGGERQTFTGTVVVPEDVEIFGATATKR